MRRTGCHDAASTQGENNIRIARRQIQVMHDQHDGLAFENRQIRDGLAQRLVEGRFELWGRARRSNVAEGQHAVRAVLARHDGVPDQIRLAARPRHVPQVAQEGQIAQPPLADQPLALLGQAESLVPELLARIVKDKELKDATVNDLKAAVTEFKQTYK